MPSQNLKLSINFSFFYQGEVVAKKMKSNNAVNFLSFLKKLKRKYAGKNYTLLPATFQFTDMKA
ncbi:MAG: hypothetical protein ABIQ31_03335 [Ferruginibacter sp.]